MLYLIKKNRAYLIATFLIIFYPMVIFLVVIMMLDPFERAFALDKLIHFCVFSIFSYFIYFIVSYQQKFLFLKIRRTLVTILFASLVGVSIEIFQLYMPTRSANVFDIIANLGGILFTIFMIKYSPKSVKRLKRYGI